jgi:hypothetical protein
MNYFKKYSKLDFYMIGVAGALIAGAVYLAQANTPANKDASTEALAAHMGELLIMMAEHEERFGKVNNDKLRTSVQTYVLKNNPKVYEKMMKDE